GDGALRRLALRDLRPGTGWVGGGARAGGEERGGVAGADRGRLARPLGAPRPRGRARPSGGPPQGEARPGADGARPAPRRRLAPRGRARGGGARLRRAVLGGGPRLRADARPAGAGRPRERAAPPDAGREAAAGSRAPDRPRDPAEPVPERLPP